MTGEVSPTKARPDGVVLVAIWFIIGAVFAVLGAAAILLFAFRAVSDVAGDGRYYAIAGVSFGLFVVVVSGVLDVAAAVGLLGLRQWGRWLAIALAAVGLLLFPIGTIVGVLIIRYLLTDEAKEAFGA